MITENLSTLKINKMTKAQYDRELAAGRIDESALYLVPDDSTALIQDVLWEGSASITPNSSKVTICSMFDPTLYDYCEITIECSSYALNPTAIRSYLINLTYSETSAHTAISGHLSWHAQPNWLSLDIVIESDGTGRCSCLQRADAEAIWSLASSTFTVTKLVGYRYGDASAITTDYINRLIDAKLGVIESGSY